MFADNHHNDGRIAVWLPAAPGMQEMLIVTYPTLFCRPPYVGHPGWIGAMLLEISDDDLKFHIHAGWQLVAPKIRGAAAKALIELGDPRAVELLMGFLEDRDEISRAEAVRTLSTIDDPRTVPALIRALDDDGFDEADLLTIGNIAADALTRIGTPEAVAAVKAWREQQDV